MMNRCLVMKALTIVIAALCALPDEALCQPDHHLYLQKGHQASNRGDLETALKWYERALEEAPLFDAAISSRDEILALLAQQSWASKSLSEQCRSGESSRGFYCANTFFSWNGQPIHPKIIEDLTTWLSDSGEQVIAINLSDSQDSNRYCCEKDINLKESDGRFLVEYREEGASFGYIHIGQADSGVHVLRIWSSGSGSGIFNNVMLLSVTEGSSIRFEGSNWRLSAYPVVLTKLGSITLGDRWNGTITIDGNTLVIGRNTDGVAGANNSNGNTDGDEAIRIDLSEGF